MAIEWTVFGRRAGSSQRDSSASLLRDDEAEIPLCTARGRRIEVRRYHTNPRKKDTDGDCYGGGAEIRAGTNPRHRRSHSPTSATPPSLAPADPGPSAPPGSSSTGVPAGTTLTPSGGMTINTAGTVVDAREITGPVVVNAPNVTIRRSRIRTNSMWAVENNSTGLLVEDSEIINRPVQPNCHDAIGNTVTTFDQNTDVTTGAALSPDNGAGGSCSN